MRDPRTDETLHAASSLPTVCKRPVRHRTEVPAARPLRMYGSPIAMAPHGPHPWAGDLDVDGLPDLVAGVESSVYPFYGHNAIEMARRPSFATHNWMTRDPCRAVPQE